MTRSTVSATSTAVGVTCAIRNNIVHHVGYSGISILGEERKACAPLVENNVCYRNMGGGIGSMKGSKATIRGNTCFENFYAGFVSCCRRMLTCDVNIDDISKEWTKDEKKSKVEKYIEEDVGKMIDDLEI